MKVLYTFAFCTLFSIQFAYSQVQPLPPTPPPPPPQLPVLLQTGGLPGIGTTLNQDYNCADLNPANLGLVGKGAPVITFGFVGLDGRLASNAVGFSTIKNFFSDSVTYQQALAAGFANHGVTLSLNIMDFGASVQIPKIGGFAFTVQDRILLNIFMNPTGANIGFNGYNSNYFTAIDTPNGDHIGVTNNPQNVSNAFNGAYVKGSYTRSYSLSYGREILNINDNIALYAGATLEYVSGFAYADGYTTGTGANASESALLSYSSTFSSLGDSSKKPNYTSIAISGPAAAAHGEGFDLGGTLVINKNIRVSASITDVGFGDMTWGDTTDQVLNTKVDSFKNYSGVGTLDKKGNKTTIVFTHPTSFTAPLPTQLHLGGSIFLIQKFVVAADIDVPLNSAGGNLEQPVTTLSGGYCPGPGFRVTIGVQNSAYAPITVPLGIVVGTGTKALWQWGISYADMLNFFRTNTVVLGGSFFFLRFRV